MPSAGEFAEGPAGLLQLQIDEPDSSPVALAVVCHPHPLYGGTLTNKVVHQLARVLAGLNVVSVRFNFRGVGESEGSYDEGRGERDDLVAVSVWARKRWPGLPLWLAGFSFGGAIALQEAAQLNADLLLTVAPAINYFPPESLSLEGIRWILVQGSEDEVVAAGDVLEWLEKLEYKPQLVMLEGASHFFHGRLIDLREAVREALQKQAGQER